MYDTGADPETLKAGAQTKNYDPELLKRGETSPNILISNQKFKNYLKRGTMAS